MHKIDGPGAAPGGLFTEGNPDSGVPATVVTDDWMNAVQAEICNAITSAGIALNKADNTQLADAIALLVRRAKPIGTVITGYWLNAPTGTLLLQGQEVSRTTYADLWAHVQAQAVVVTDAEWAAGEKSQFSSGNGTTTFRLPDLRDEFIRVRASGRSLGSRQDDAVGPHQHNMDFEAFSEASGGTTNHDGFVVGSADASLGDYTNDVAIQNNAGTTETRPRNTALTAAIFY
jgi:hypothetical protein